MSVEPISAIRKKFKNQWLLIRVNKMNKATTTPLTGQIIAHSPDRDFIYKKSITSKGLVFIDHSSTKLPKGYAVAF